MHACATGKERDCPFPIDRTIPKSLPKSENSAMESFGENLIRHRCVLLYYFMREVIMICGWDPDHTTTKEMVTLNLIFECLKCNSPFG